MQLRLSNEQTVLAIFYSISNQATLCPTNRNTHGYAHGLRCGLIPMLIQSLVVYPHQKFMCLSARIGVSLVKIFSPKYLIPIEPLLEALKIIIIIF